MEERLVLAVRGVATVLALIWLWNAAYGDETDVNTRARFMAAALWCWLLTWLLQ